MRTDAYEAHKALLQVELLKVQRWVEETGQKLVILFEGRDAAGKGGTIKRFMEHLNPRTARVVALSKPTERERTQWYYQRYIEHLPAAGEIVMFDRSWYNRAGVERVMGFCSPNEYLEFMRETPELERMLTRSGIWLFKYWFSVTHEEQLRRFRERENDPLKQWKLSPVDRASLDKWEEYTEAKEAMFFYTDTADCALDSDQVQRQEAGAHQLHAASAQRPALSKSRSAGGPCARSADRRPCRPCDRARRSHPGQNRCTRNRARQELRDCRQQAGGPQPATRSSAFFVRSISSR